MNHISANNPNSYFHLLRKKERLTIFDGLGITTRLIIRRVCKSWNSLFEESVRFPYHHLTEAEFNFLKGRISLFDGNKLFSLIVLQKSPTCFNLILSIHFHASYSLLNQTINIPSNALYKQFLNFQTELLKSKDHLHAYDNLAKMLKNGQGVLANETLALTFFKKAAERGHADAQFHLGRMYFVKQGVAIDNLEAFRWFRKAAEQGHAEAQREYAAFLIANDEPKLGFKWAEKAAKQGLAEAQHLLGQIYEEGSGIKKDEMEAFAWFRKAAEQDYALAQVEVGMAYQSGLKDIKKDTIAAYKWFRKAAEQNNPKGLSALGEAYLWGFGVKKNEKEAIKWFSKAAEQGEPHAQYTLSYMIDQELGMQKDAIESFKWCLKSAEQGNAEAQHYLSLKYRKGEGIAKDQKTGFKWMLAAAKQGLDYAQYDVGWLYREGEGVKKDENASFHWILEAAKQGYVDAQSNVGNMYYEGIGVKKDEKEAFEWSQRAAEQGEVHAQLNVGTMFYEGKGVKKDLVKATFWLQKAAEQGNAQSKSLLETIQNKEAEEKKKKKKKEKGSHSTDHQTQQETTLELKPPVQELKKEPEPKKIDPQPVPSLESNVEPPKSILKPPPAPPKLENEKTERPQKQSTLKRILHFLDPREQNRLSADESKSEPKRAALKRTQSSADLRSLAQGDEQPPTLSKNHLDEEAEEVKKPKGKRSFVRSVSMNNLTGKQEPSSSESSPISTPNNSSTPTPRNSKRLSRQLSIKDLKSIPQEKISFNGENYSKLKKALTYNSTGILSKTQVDASVILRTFEQLTLEGLVDYRQNGNTLTVTVKGNSLKPFVAHMHSKPDKPWYENPDIVNDFFGFLKNGFPSLLTSLGWTNSEADA